MGTRPLYSQSLFYCHLFYTFVSLTPLANLDYFLICATSLSVINNLWLAALHYANPLFLMGILLFIHGHILRKAI